MYPPACSAQMKGRLKALRKLTIRKSRTLSVDANLCDATVFWVYFKDSEAERWGCCQAHNNLKME